MTDKADHIAWAADAIAVYQRHCRTGDEHAIADLICDLGHLAEERGFDFISEVRRGIGHWSPELHAEDRNDLGRMLQSRSRSARDGDFPPGICGPGTVASKKVSPAINGQRVLHVGNVIWLRVPTVAAWFASRVVVCQACP